MVLANVHIVNLVGVSFEFLRTAQAPFMSTLLTGRVVVDPVIIVLLMYSQCITILMIERKTPFRIAGVYLELCQLKGFFPYIPKSKRRTIEMHIHTYNT